MNPDEHYRKSDLTMERLLQRFDDFKDRYDRDAKESKEQRDKLMSVLNEHNEFIEMIKPIYNKTAYVITIILVGFVGVAVTAIATWFKGHWHT